MAEIELSIAQMLQSKIYKLSLTNTEAAAEMRVPPERLKSWLAGSTPTWAYTSQIGSFLGMATAAVDRQAGVDAKNKQIQKRLLKSKNKGAEHVY